VDGGGHTGGDGTGSGREITNHPPIVVTRYDLVADAGVRQRVRTGALVERRRCGS
jgi:hypothetical protein